MRTIICLVALLLVATCANADQIDLTTARNGLSSLIGASIANGSGDQARLQVSDNGPMAIYGIFSTSGATTISVTPYTSVEGTYWKPLYGAGATSDSSVTYTFPGLTAVGLQVYLPVATQAKLPGASGALTTYGLLPGTRLKIVVRNTGASAISGGQWWLVTNQKQ